MSDKYEGFRELNDMARAQKERVLEGATGGFEPHSHALYKTLLPAFRERYGANKARDMVSMLGYLHASKVGETSSLKIAPELRGWAMVKVETIMRDLAMSKRTVNDGLRLLQEERMLIVRKAPYNGNIKNYYLPFYYPFSDGGSH
ncbi:hypothetical protein [Shouchella clausii]|jgi:hypothetical protein|uniref:hypothetical protein n=1 Tax=Shouchella clausii TaxID=79880 RepID=UPI000BA5019B|nr:hypothetical protein [Shouchella clausii]MCY1105852.1 hypothetical protein [Shouchella clausii]PAD91630.1 hypothetical protein CHH52_13480 [Shouchella clausii]GIN10204.1 hypothetical protein J26TS2_00710 [Shouchella clausii]